MEESNLVSLLILAFGLGMMHALDADHVMAVSGLASTEPRMKKIIGFCLRWAIGHGFSLFIIGSAVLLLGMAIPNSLSHYAETAVGIMLIIIGSVVIVDLLVKKAHLHFHHHDGIPEHAHWHTHKRNMNHQRDKHLHQHGAVLVGVVHGIAGSAPLLVLLPIAQLGSPAIGIAYIGLFSVGVLITMLAFGGVMGGVYHWLSQCGTAAVKSLRAIVGSSAIGFGTYLLFTTAH